MSQKGGNSVSSTFLQSASAHCNSSSQAIVMAQSSNATVLRRGWVFFPTADEIMLSLASEIAKLHNSSQLRSYMNYHNFYQVISTTILRLQLCSTVHCLWLAT